MPSSHLGRDIRHTLLVHHNLLNALFLADVMQALREDGWKWIHASEAFRDPVFKREPQTVPAGESLVWALAKESGRFESKTVRYPAATQPGNGVKQVSPIKASAHPSSVSRRSRFSRKLLEVLFDGRPEADALLNANPKTFFSTLAADRKLLTIPADATVSAKLAKHYANASLGEIAVSTSGASTVFDFGEWKSEVASRKNPDGTISFITIVPGLIGSEFVVGSGPKRTLITRDAQHEYTFEER